MKSKKVLHALLSILLALTLIKKSCADCDGNYCCSDSDCQSGYHCGGKL